MATRPSSLTLYDRATPQERAEIRRKTLAIACVDCGARPGNKCRSFSGHPSKPHYVRRYRAANPIKPQPTTEQRLAALEEQVAMLRGFLNI